MIRSIENMLTGRRLRIFVDISNSEKARNNILQKLADVSTLCTAVLALIFSAAEKFLD